jgi:superfamily II DNA or RNA helicase
MNGWLSPFHVLGVPVSASREQIAERAEELARTCAAEEDRKLIIWAKAELTTDPALRARHERTEPRNTDYARQQRWETFVRAFNRNPVTAQSLADDGEAQEPAADNDASQLRDEDVDLAAAVRILIRRAADSGLDSLNPLFQTMPANDADGVSRLQIRDVLFG